MKVTLPNKELTYLNVLMQAMLELAGKTPLQEDRLMKKMRYKFTPNALYVSLNQRERALITTALGYRQAVLAKQNSISDEFNLIDSIMKKVEL